MSAESIDNSFIERGNYENTFSAVCATTDWRGVPCSWKTGPKINIEDANRELENHFRTVHSNNAAPYGYVNLTTVISKLKI